MKTTTYSLERKYFLFFFILCCFSLKTSLATVTNTTTTATFASLQAAINDAGTLPGHTLVFNSGISEALVTVNKAVTIDGNGFTFTSTSSFWGINPSVPGVTLTNLTVQSAGTFGIISTCGADNLVMTNVTVTGCGGTGIALAGSDNLILTNITSTNNIGNGISITNCDNVSINGLTTSGNSFGSFGAGIGLFTTTASCPPAGINGFSLTGTISIAENPKVYSQKASASDVITGLSGSSISWAVGTSAVDRSYWPDKPTAYFVAKTLMDPPYNFPNTTVYVAEVSTENFYVDDNPAGDNVPPMLIQTAINFEAPGQTIFVEAGTYNELDIINKSITLNGANAGIHPAIGTHPSASVGVRGPESIISHNGLYAFSPAADNIAIDGFKFTGSGGRIIDTYSNASNFHLTNCIFNDPGVGSSQGVIQFGGGIHNNMTFDFNLFKDNGDATIYTGGGPFNNLLIQYNKFQSYSDAIFWTASAASGCIVDHNEFDGEAGLNDCNLNIGQAGDIQISNNWFHDIYYTAIQCGIIGGSITGNKFETHYGISGFNAAAIQLWGGEFGTAVSTNVTIANNEIQYNQDGTGPVNGIRLRGPNSPSDPKIDGSTIHVHNNSFINGQVRSDANAILFQGDLSTSVDASCNWFANQSTPLSYQGASFSGPVSYIPHLTSGVDASANFGFQPAMGCSAPCTLVASATSTDATCPTQNNGTATASVVSGGVGPYTYSWNTSPIQTTITATALTTGTYTVTVTDLNGCTATASAVVVNSLAGPVHNINSGLNFCTIQAAIDDALTTTGHTITIDPGTYNEQVLVNKSVIIKAATATQPTVNFTGTVTGKPTLFDISADAVTIDNIHFNVDLSKLKSAIIASGATIDNIIVKNNIIDAYGTPSSGTYGDRNAVSINYGGSTNYRVATGGVNSITFDNNTVNGSGAASYFRAGLATDESGGTFTNNTLQTINHDIISRFGSNGNITITGNNFNGGGVELDDMNAGAGTLTVATNIFNATFANFSAPGTAVLRLQNNYNAKTTLINNNTFSNHQWAVSLANYNSVSLDNNTFTPLAGSTSFHHVVIGTKAISSNSASIVQVTIGASLTNNTFNGSGSFGGTALSFQNHDNDNAAFGTFTIGTAGNENKFNDGIAYNIYLDHQSGTSSGSTFPDYNSLIGGGGGALTTMALWAPSLDATNNKFDVGAGLQLPAAMSLANLFALEDRIQHSIDLSGLGFVTVKPNNDYVTVNSFVSPLTTAGSIQRGVDAASNGWTVNVNSGTFTEDVTVNKQVTVLGQGSGSSIASGAIGGGGATFQVTSGNVVIDGFTITRDGNTVAQWNLALNTAGVAIQSQGNFAEVRNCEITGNRTGIDINNSNGNNIHNNNIHFNRTGMILRNQTDNTSVLNNFIKDNWTAGVLFIDGSVGTNSPVQSAANSFFNNNDISGNWYGQIQDRQSGGSIPAPGTNLKNFTCNWYGTTTPSKSALNSTEPGYAAQIPVLYGGAATPPGGQTDVSGTASDNFVYIPYLTSGTDLGGNANDGFQPAVGCSAPCTLVASASSTDATCPLLNNGTATASIVSGGVGPYSYSWNTSPVQTTVTATALTIGTYTVTVTDANGCTATASAVVSNSLAGPVHNINTGLNYCTIQAAINDPLTLNTHTITIDPGTYNEQVLVNKSLTIQAATATQPTVNFTGTVTGKPTLFDISADAVTIDNIHFNVDLSKLKSAIIASGATIDNIIVKNNIIDAYGTPASGTYGDRNAVSINYGGSTNYRVATGGVNSITFDNNTVNGSGAASYFRAGLATDESGGTFTNNTLQTINHDIISRFGSNGNITITGNNFNGGGVELDDMNAGAGTLTVATNIFNATFANFSAPGTAVLRLQNNYNAKTTLINNNTFSNHQWAVSLANYNSVSLDNNTFTPLAGSTSFHHVVIGTKAISSNSASIVQVTIGASLTNNTFNGSGTFGGTALAFQNHDNDNAAFGTFTIGTAGNENKFNDGIAYNIYLDHQSGTSSGSTFPDYNSLIGGGGGALTTMALWAPGLDATNNTFDVGAGLQLPAAMSLANLFALEDRIQHSIDLSGLGFVTVKPNNDYVTVNSFVSPLTTAGSIQRGVDAASNGWTVNVNSGTFTEDVTVNKQVTVLGQGSGASIASGAIGGGGATFQVTSGNVVIDGFTITRDGNTVAQWNLALNTAGVAIQSQGNFAEVRNCEITGNRTGIDINNSNGNNIHNNNIHFNRTGMILRNQTDNTSVLNNFIKDNWTAGVLFIDGSVGTNSPVQSAANSFFNNNDISGNWYGQIQDRQSGGALLTPGTNPKNFTCNWYGTTTPSKSALNSTEPGYAAQIPVLYGGAATPPGGQTDVSGTASDNFVYIPYLTSGTDLGGNANDGFQPAVGCSAPCTLVASASSTDATCPLLNNGTATASVVSGGVGPYSYSWNTSPVQTTVTATALTIGTYTVTVTDLNGCTASASVAVIASPASPVHNINTGIHYCTIQSAIDDPLTLNGHTIAVDPGTYNEQISVTKSISLQGANYNVSCLTGRTAETIINGTGGSATTAVTINADGVTINGFTISNPLGSFGIYAKGRNNTDIEYNIITDIGNAVNGSTASYGVAIEMGATANTNNVNVSNNCVNNIRGGANTSLTGAAAKANNGSGVAIGAGFSTANFDITNLIISSNTIDNITASTAAFPDGGKGAYGVLINVGANNANNGKAINPLVSYNDISNLEGLWAHGVGLEGETPGASVNNNDISILIDHKGNTDAIGVLIEDNAGSASVAIHLNSFTNMALGVSNLTAPTIDATCNWYGSTVPATVTSKNNGPLTFIPWLISNAEFSAATGFWPSATCLPCSLAVNTTTTAADCPLFSNGTATAQVSNGTGTYAYSWNTSPVQTNVTATALVTGTYTVTVTDLNGCTASASASVGTNYLPPVKPLNGASTVECAPSSPPVTPVVLDVCGNSITPTGPTITGSYAGCEGTRIYDYTYTDIFGGSTTWTYTYTIDHTIPPVVPANATSTVTSIVFATTPLVVPVVYDVCGTQLTPSLTVINTPNPVICAGTRVYKYTYTDCSGLSSDWTFTYVIDINDNNVCTIDACDSNTGIITYTPVNRDDNNPCTNDYCDPISGIFHTAVDINDNDVCTTDACNTLNGSITHIAINTDDGNACTTDGCNSVTGEFHTAVSVEDNNPCTFDGCNPVTGVYHIDQSPSAPISGGNQVQCQQMPYQTLTAAAFAPSGSSVVWYDAPTGGNVVLNPVLNTAGTITYYAESKLNTANCTSLTRTAVSLTIFEAVTSNAGPDQAQCNSGNFTLAGSAPAPGTGLWTVVTGTASITTPTSATSAVTGIPSGSSVTLRWTVTNGTCSAFDDVVLTNNSSVTANAGPVQNQCNNGSFTLNGSSAAPGTGLWTIILGTVSISNPSASNTSVSGLAAGNFVTLRWTVTNGTCSAFDQVVLTNYAPVTSNAGPDQVQCNNGSFTLSGNIPVTGVGLWTVVSGTASITSPNVASTMVTGVPSGTSVTLRWTTTNQTCNAFDDVVLTNNSSVTANAGPDQAQCNNGSFTLNGSSAAPGTGLWTVVSGTISITSPTASNSAVSGLAAGSSATLRWTVTNGTCSANDDVVLTNNSAVTSNAGPDQAQCNSGNFTLAGSAPAPGTGLWTVVTGTASITTPTSATSAVTGVPSGSSVTLRWTVTNGTCSAFDDVVLTNNSSVTANAGPDQAQCNNGSFTLNGSSAAPGTGLWTVVSGTISITSPTASNSAVSGLAAGSSATLRWTVTNGTCSANDDVVLTNNAAVTSNAGPDQAQCNSGSFTLAGSAPAPGTGLWTVVTGTASITTPTSATSAVTGVPSGSSVTLRWTVTNGTCSAFDDVVLTNNSSVTSNAGPDQAQCNNGSFTLNGSSAAPGTGLWTVVSGTISITSPTASNSAVSGLAAGSSATLRWTVTNGTCSANDDVVLTNNAAVTSNAGPDQAQCNSGSFTLAGSAPAPGTGLWTVVTGTASITTPTSATSAVTGVPSGSSVTLRWTVTNGTCSAFDDVVLTNNSSVTSNAGPDQAQCNNGSFTLNGSSAAPGTGLWTVVSGTISITSPTASNSAVSGLAAGSSATLRWTVTNGTCSANDDVVLTNNAAVTSNAGPDQAQCNSGNFTLAGSAPAPGTGLWTVVTGTASITTPTSATSAVTGVPSGSSVTLRWTVTNGTCSAFDDVVLTNNSSVTANAGPDQAQCNNGSFTLNGSSAAPGTGLWTVVSGTISITSPTASNSAVSGLAAGSSATLRWTVTNGTCSANDDVVLTNNSAVTSNAGPDQAQCNSGNFTLAGSAPAPGTGLWTVVTGTASITTPTSATSAVTGVPSGSSVTLRWTVTNGTCSAFDDVVLTNNSSVTANAGPDQAQCNNGSFTLNGSSAAPGTGLWTVVSGTISITSPTASNSAVSGLAAGSSATLRWTVTNGTCSANDDVVLTNNAAVTSNAGPDQAQCNSGSFTLAGSAPAPGTGLWTVVTGTASITTPTSATSAVTGVPSGSSVTLRWTVTNGTCSAFDDVVLTNNSSVTANAGPDQAQCNNGSYLLTGNTPSPGTGNWSIVSGTASIGSPSSFITIVNGVPSGSSTTLRWTITNGTCSSTDDVILTNDALIISNAGADQVNCNNGSFTLNGNNPLPGMGIWTVITGTANIASPLSANSSVSGVPAGTSATLRWTIVNGTCVSSDDVVLTNNALITANAGPDQVQCSNSTFILAGNAPSPGTGSWTLISGTATISSPGTFNTSVIGIPLNSSVTLRWTITNGNCSSFDDVTLTLNGIDDFNACTIDVCNVASGLVSHTAVVTEDGNACTTDGCNSLTGIFHTPVDPNDNNLCTIDGCDPVYGIFNTPVNTNDNNICTKDFCVPSIGIIHDPVEVDDFNACTNDGCDPNIGIYHSPLLAIDDGNICTNDQCEPLTGTISHIPINVNDGNACTTDGCNSITGEFHNPVSYNDGNACTTDGCDPVSGVYHNTVPVTDFNACTTDACNTTSGAITHTAVNIDDNNVCTTDACDIITGTISHTPISIDDFNVCTTDACNSVSGVSHTPLPTNDGNVCTVDGCDALTGVYHNPVSTEDFNVCTTDGCQSVTGVFHDPVNTDDGNACTIDGCDAITGPYHMTVNSNDNNICTADGCNTLTGIFNIPVNTDDANGCTTDGCDPFTGVFHTPVNVNDNDVCTTDACESSSGIITHTALNTNDGNACTVDGCDPLTGIFHTPVNISDSNPCTIDGCDPITGVTHTPVDVNDNDNCTVDACDVRTGMILHTDATPTVSATPGIISCYGSSTCVNVTASGGFPPYFGTGQICGYTAGSYTFVVADAHGCIAVSQSVDITQPPKFEALTSFTNATCNAANGTATAIPSGGNPTYQYLWSNGQTTQTAVGLAPGSYTVRITDALGCSATSAPVTITSSGAAPAPPVAINGATNLCKGQCITYTIAAVSGATSYTWSIPYGTTGSSTGTSITLCAGTKFNGGFICVKANSPCGSSAFTCLKIDPVLSKPAAPATITGNFSVCSGTSSTQTYCVSPISGATSYVWSIYGNANPSLSILSGQGTTCITVNVPAGYPGNQYIRVYATNCKGNGNDKKTIVTRVQTPAQPGTISGLSAICRSATSGSYSISSVSGATSYNWTVSGGATIASGQNTTAVTINFTTVPPTTTSVTISVTAINACGTSAARTKAVNINNCKTVAPVTVQNGKEYNGLSSLTAYPNPTHGKLNLSFNSDRETRYNLRVVDVLGNIVINEDLTITEGYNNREINLENVSKGMYFVSVQSEGTEIQTLRIIVE